MFNTSLCVALEAMFHDLSQPLGPLSPGTGPYMLSRASMDDEGDGNADSHGPASFPHLPTWEQRDLFFCLH